MKMRPRDLLAFVAAVTTRGGVYAADDLGPGLAKSRPVPVPPPVERAPAPPPPRALGNAVVPDVAQVVGRIVIAISAALEQTDRGARA